MRILISVILGLLAACGSSPKSNDNDTTKDSAMTSANDSAGKMSADTSGWQSLFDGKSLAGWHGYHNGNISGWKADSGMLYLASAADKKGHSIGVDLISDGEYENFDFVIDWKISEGGNSGIMFGVNESPKYDYDYYTGPEMQVLDNEKHDDGKIEKHRAGDLYDLISANPVTVKPVGEWNTAEIIKKNGKLEFKLNGASVVRTTIGDDNWKKLIAGSKFKQWPDFGTFQSGHFALQDHGHQVWFRNIRIRKL